MLNVVSRQNRNSATDENNRVRRPIAIDLFSGVGGLSLGFEQAGFDIVASVEYDPVHAAVHEFNFPITEVICDDVAKLDPQQLLSAAKRGFLAHGHKESEWTGEIDAIFGGPPCQGFSTMGKRDIGDERNKLVYRFADLIGSIRPRYYVMENVPGMAAGGHASILARLIARLRKHGYRVSVEAEDVRRRAILNAADYGVPQDRRRLILLGARDDQRDPQYPIPTVRRAPKRSNDVKAQAHPFDFLPKGPTVGEAILDLPDLDQFEDLWDTDEVQLNKNILRVIERKASEYAKRLRGDTIDPSDFSYPRVWDPTILTSSMRTQHTRESVGRFAATKNGETETISRFYKLDPNGLCNTLRAGTGSERGAYTSPRPLHPELPRVISMREAARLHSFPDWFRFHRTKWHGFRSIGNAVPPLFGRAVARTIIYALGIEPTKPRKAIKLGDIALLSLDRLSAAEHFGASEKTIPKSRKRLVNV